MLEKQTLIIVFTGLGAYLIGAIPTGYLAGRLNGVDIRKLGSGNIGATNVYRCVGKFWGILTFVFDFGKGYLPAALFPALIQDWIKNVSIAHLALLFGCLAIIGHNWPVWLKFRGGKGIATGAGVLLGVAPLAMLIGIMSWLLVFILTRYVSLASMLAALVIAGSAWWFYSQDIVIAGVLSIMAGIVIWRHQANIKRLLNGTENRFKGRDQRSKIGDR